MTHVEPKSWATWLSRRLRISPWWNDELPARRCESPGYCMPRGCTLCPSAARAGSGGSRRCGRVRRCACRRCRTARPGRRGVCGCAKSCGGYSSVAPLCTSQEGILSICEQPGPALRPSSPGHSPQQLGHHPRCRWPPLVPPPAMARPPPTTQAGSLLAHRTPPPPHNHRRDSGRDRTRDLSGAREFRRRCGGSCPRGPGAPTAARPRAGWSPVPAAPD